MIGLFGSRELAPTVVLGSTSPAKMKAVVAALHEVRGAALGASAAAVKVEAVAAVSGVPDQPWGDDETRRGAKQRAQQGLLMTPHADLAFGVEGGVQGEPDDGPIWVFAWVVALAKDGVSGSARSATFVLPDDLAAAVRKGVELGTALDAAYGLTRAKDGVGAVGVLTGGLLNRAELYRQAVLLALLPWLQPLPHSGKRLL